MSRIAITRDFAEVTGEFAEKVENRSLLLEKFVLHKKWGLEGAIKENEAFRWSLLRVSDRGAATLRAEAASRERASRGQYVEDHNRERMLDEAKVMAKLANTRCESSDAQQLRREHSNRLLGLIRSSHPGTSVILCAELQSRLAINLADGLLQNAGLALDRLFGLPYIPGSALKGCARHAALWQLQEAPPENQPALLEKLVLIYGVSESDWDGDLSSYRTYFKGNQGDLKGAICFLPAYPVSEARVVVDLTTVHYPDYYRSGEPSALANEKPLPNPFPAVERGAVFGFPLIQSGMSSDPELLDAAREHLELAITVNGLGAKTASGYGWFQLRSDMAQKILADELAQRKKALEEAQKAAETARINAEKAQRLASLSPAEAARERFLAMSDDLFANTAKTIAAMPEADQRGFLLTFTTSKEKRERLKMWRKKDKKDILTPLTETAGKLGITLP